MKMIVCAAENNAIGNNNGLLFSIPQDMKFFRSETLGKVVIMGRSTLDSFPGGKPLKNRVNIVLTRNKGFEREGAVVVHSYDEAMKKISEYPSDDVYIIGGSEIYALFEKDCDEILLTRVYEAPQADKFFFDIDSSPTWIKTEESEIYTCENIKFSFNKYIKH